MVLIFAIIFNGHMMQRFGYYMPWYFFGSAFELVAAVLMCMSSKSAPLVANTTFSTSQLDLERRVIDRNNRFGEAGYQSSSHLRLYLLDGSGCRLL